MSWMVDEIRARGGAVPFDVYMDLALYHPEHGYYSAASPRYGRDADYVTAPTASEWYPRVAGRLLRVLARDRAPLQIVDLAAGDGSFLAGMQEALSDGSAAAAGSMVAIERSPSMRQRIADRLGADRVTIAGHLAEIQPFGGTTVVHASELYDAQPVVRVVGRDRGLDELWVGENDGALAWEERPPRDEVEEYFVNHGVVLEEGQIAEANLGAFEAHLAVLRASGPDAVMLTLDYGYEASRLYNPRGRRGGSLATFRRHTVDRDPLQSPGEIDLTAHVNWNDLRGAADEAGWAEIGLWPLAEFLVRAGLADELEARGLGMEAEIDAATFSARQEVKRLLDPEGMGSDLKMLVQASGAMVDIASGALALNSQF